MDKVWVLRITVGGAREDTFVFRSAAEVHAVLPKLEELGYEGEYDAVLVGIGDIEGLVFDRFDGIIGDDDNDDDLYDDDDYDDDEDDDDE